MRAADAANMGLHILIDNSAVQQRFKAVCDGELTLPEYGFKRWIEISKLCENRQHSTSWVPSHGKKTEWKPEHEGDQDVWRRLNDAADKQASKFAAEQWEARFKDWNDAFEQADTFADKVLHSLLAASRSYGERVDLQQSVLEAEHAASSGAWEGPLTSGLTTSMMNTLPSTFSSSYYYDFSSCDAV